MLVPQHLLPGLPLLAWGHHQSSTTCREPPSPLGPHGIVKELKAITRTFRSVAGEKAGASGSSSTSALPEARARPAAIPPRHPDTAPWNLSALLGTRAGKEAAALLGCGIGLDGCGWLPVAPEPVAEKQKKRNTIDKTLRQTQNAQFWTGTENRDSTSPPVRYSSGSQP